MYKNIHYDSYSSKIHLWDQVNGENLYSTIDYVPHVFMPVEVETPIKSIYGEYVAKRTFDDYKEYNHFQSSNDSCLENKVQPTISYLTNRYHDIKTPVLPDLHICFFDIETPYDNGFPTVEDTPAPVVLIAIVDEKEKRTVFGIGEYTRNPENVPYDDIEYINCEDEKDLLIKFFNWMHEQNFDIITGWNITPDNKMNKFGGFDLPYLIRRAKMVFGKNDRHHKKLSPINIVKCYKSKNKDGIYNVDIAGVTILDYLAIFKWFSTLNMESFRLDYVAEVILGKNKLDYKEYGSLWNLYNQNWNKFVDYCIIDADIVHDIDVKMGYISLVQVLTTYCLVPMKQYNSSVALLEGLFLKYFRNNNLCAPRLNSEGTTDHFMAAYVKKPIPGMYYDVVDVDITSSYPFNLVVQNMSNETYFGRILGFSKDHVREYKAGIGIHEELHYGKPIYQMIVDYIRKKEFPGLWIMRDTGIEHYQGKKLEKFNQILQRRLISISPNGCIFMNQPLGVMSMVVKDTYMERKKQKGMKGEYKSKAREFDKGSDEYIKWMDRSNNKHSLQWALKILVNSAFGICSVPYSRYGDIHMAEAITSSGRHCIQQSEIFVDDLLNSPSDELKKIVDEIRSVMV